MYIRDILDVFKHMQCSDVIRCIYVCMWYSRGIQLGVCGGILPQGKYEF